MHDSDDKTAAEDYRLQGQQADAVRNGFDAMSAQDFWGWMNANRAKLEELAKANGVPESEIESVLAEHMKELQNAPVGSSFDNPNLQAILARTVTEIEQACSALSVSLAGGVAFGVSPEVGAVASQRAVMATSASIITVSMQFLGFCNAISKILSRSLVEDTAQSSISNDPARVSAKLEGRPDLVTGWFDIVFHMATYGWQTPVPVEIPTSPTERIGRFLLLRAVERFALAHEFGHHVYRHGISVSSEDDGDPMKDEYEADLFGRIISIELGFNADSIPNPYCVSGAGGVVILGALDLVRRATSVLESGTDSPPPRRRHPPYEERVAALQKADNLLSPDWEEASVDMRRSFHQIIEILWERLLPLFVEAHDQGARPYKDANPSGWLP
jgi:hypothetical protein